METPDGTRYWGRFGAAGLLALDPARGVLLQHRVSWSHFGGTWGLPGGALHEGESAVVGALRVAWEEAGVPKELIRPRLVSVLDLGYWSYTTLVGEVRTPFEPSISDPESYALEWVPPELVAARVLHPGFGAAWPQLRAALAVRPAIVVDAANVVGSVPDGWWKDRAGANHRMLGRIAALAADGVPAAALDLAEDAWYPEWTVVVEGRARSVPDQPGIEVVRADGSGDDTIAAEARRLAGSGRTVIVVTSDRGLALRVAADGARVRGTRWLRTLLPE